MNRHSAVKKYSGKGKSPSPLFCSAAHLATLTEEELPLVEEGELAFAPVRRSVKKMQHDV